MIRRALASALCNTSTFNRPLRATLMVAAFLAISAADGPAKAGTISSCTPTIVWFDGYSGGRVAVFCNGELNLNNAFISNVNETACPGKNMPLDVIKVWTSMVTAYQLAGRKITIDFNDPAGSCNIKTIINIRNVP